MPNWHASMKQTFEYYIVDPSTWKDIKQINTVTGCNITRDSTSETLGSASIDVNEELGEAYIRVYLITDQNGVVERFPLGTYLVQTPSTTFNGKYTSVTLDAYTPLLELKETMPDIGYTIPKGKNIIDMAYDIVRDNLRAPVISTTKEDLLQYDFVANSDDTWSSFVTDLLQGINYTLQLDELGRVLFMPNQDVKTLQSLWEYNDDNSSILYPEITMDRDLYGIPNVVEVIYSNGDDTFYSRVVNDDVNSQLSVQNRGREILYRDTSPSILGNATQEQVDRYATQLLSALSSIEYTVTYKHGYCPVRVGDCVRLNYKLAGIKDVKAKVITQTISCEPGCPVTETAVFTDNLWR